MNLVEHRIVAHLPTVDHDGISLNIDLRAVEPRKIAARIGGIIALEEVGLADETRPGRSGDVERGARFRLERERIEVERTAARGDGHVVVDYHEDIFA